MFAVVNTTGGRRNMGTGSTGLGGGQMDGREAKANNFALLYTCIGGTKMLAVPKFHNETLSIFVICRHKISRLKKNSR